MRVAVVGAGVIGLTTAHELVHRGHEVRVLTRELPAATTSARAGASFKPTRLGDFGGLSRLLADSWDALEAWRRSGFADALSIRLARHYEASDEPLADDVAWWVPGPVERLDDPARIPGGFAHAVAYDTFHFDAPRTLAALAGHLLEHRVSLDVAELRDLAEAAEPGTDAVVDASGLGARRLADDARVRPVRGQTVTVARPAGDPDWSISADGRYCYPRGDELLLGGTTEPDVWEAQAEPDEVGRIVGDCHRLRPGTVDAEVLATGAGLRPLRDGGPRLQAVAGPPLVVHAYGHGGAGWTLATGTARWVAGALAGRG